MARSRAVIAIVGCLVAGLYLEGHRPVGSTLPSSGPGTTPATSGSSEPPTFDPPPPVETPYRVVLAALPREAYPDVEQKGSTVHVRYRLDPSMMSVAMGRRAFDRSAAQLVPELLARFPAVNTVEIEADAATKDIRGSRSRGSAASVTFTRRNAGTIRWDAIDSADVEQLADSAWYDRRFR